MPALYILKIKADNGGVIILNVNAIEHTFGTLKHWMGASHFLIKTKAHVSTEMSLHILAYNMKWVMKIMGSVALIKAMAA